MGEKLDQVLGLGLSLSLGGSALKENHMQQSVAMKSSSSNHLFLLPPPAAADRTSDSDARPFLGGIDMNSAPVPDCEDDDHDNCDNSTVSSSSGKRSEREEDNGAGAATEFDEEDGGGSGDMPRKKLRLTKEQSVLLEEMFRQHNTLNSKQKQALAKELNLRPRQVEVWFQNRRARTKLKQTEVDCEYLKRCCENLSEENRRLHKEVQELRALKLSPHLYMYMNPPTTLTMCPSCERVATSSSSSGTTAHSAAQLPPSNCNNLLALNIRRPLRVNSWPFKGSISRP